MADVVQAHLRKLNTPSAFLQRQVVAAIFQTLGPKDSSSSSVDTIRGLASACLEHESVAVVEETVDQLIWLDKQRTDIRDHAVDMLLASLASVRPAAAAVIAHGIVELFFRLHSHDPKPCRAHSHPLVSAWFSSPAAPTPLLASLGSHMACLAAAEKLKRPGRQLTAAFDLVKPFVMYVLLVGPDTGSSDAAAWQLAGAELCLKLVQWGFTHTSLSLPILSLLLRCLQNCRVPPHTSGATLLQNLPSVMDLLEFITCSESEHDAQSNGAGNEQDTLLPAANPAHWSAQLVCQCARVLVHLMKLLADSNATLTQPLSCLLRLRQLPSGDLAVAEQFLPLAELAVNATAADFEPIAALLLTGIQLSATQAGSPLVQPLQAREESTRSEVGDGMGDGARVGHMSHVTMSHVCHMALFAVLPKLALSTSPQTRLWCRHLLASLQQQCQTGDGAQLAASPAAAASPHIKSWQTGGRPDSSTWSAAVALSSVSSGKASSGKASSGKPSSGKAVGYAATLAEELAGGVVEQRPSDLVQLVAGLVYVLGCPAVDGSELRREDVAAWLAPWTGAAPEWLDSLQLCLHYSRSPISSLPPRPTPPNPSPPAPVTPPVCMALTALLSHPSPCIQISAATTLRHLLLFQPFTGLPFLPLVLYLLGQGSSLSPHGSAPSTQAIGPMSPAPRSDAVLRAAKQQALLHVLPAMVADSTMGSYAQRALQPLTSASSPHVVYTGGLRLLVDMWALTGRGWNKVEDVLVGYADPKSQPPLQLRLARAGLVLQVCQSDASKGLQLVPAIQQCSTDPDPAVASLGLQALNLLCQDDTVDFYKAFSVLHKWHPRLPEEPLLAAQWVDIMGRGALDAEAYPDRATAIVELLWSLVEHPANEVRAAAYSALAAYPLELLEKLDAAAELRDYMSPCMTETSSIARPAAEDLAVLALHYEHNHRRRFLLMSARPSDATAGVAGGKETGVLTHRLAHTLPRVLCPSSRIAKPASRQQATPHSGPYLLLQHLHFNGSNKSPAQPGDHSTTNKHPSSKPDNTKADKHLSSKPDNTKADKHISSKSDKSTSAALKQQAIVDAEVQQSFEDTLVQGLHSLQWNDWTHPWMALQSWDCFFEQWQRHVSWGAEGELQRVLGVLEQLWLQGSAAEEENCCWAAGGLCSALARGASSSLHFSQSPSPQTTIHTLLNRLHDKALEARSAGVQRAALAAATHVSRHMDPCDPQAWEGTLQLLQQFLGEGGSFSADNVGVCADAAAFLCCGLLRMEEGGAGVGLPQVLQTSGRALGLLLSILGQLWPHHLAAILQSTSLLPSSWQVPAVELNEAFVEQLVRDEEGQCGALPQVVCSVAALMVGLQQASGSEDAALDAFRDIVEEELRSVSTMAGASAAMQGNTETASRQQVADGVAAIRAVPTLLLHSLRSQQGVEGGLELTLQQLRSVISAETVDGQVRGSATWAMGQLLYGLLQDTTKVPSELSSDIHLLASVLSVPSKRPHSSVGRCGAATALALLLGAEPAWPTSLVLSGNSSVLTAVTSAGAARKALKVLEGAALSESDPRVSGVAAWALAAACCKAYRAQQDPHPGSAVSGGSELGPEVKPLTAYPSNGAVRPLAVALLDSSKRSELGVLSVACMLRCLSRCPRLPAANWSGLLRQLLRPLKPVEDSLEQDLQMATCNFLLAHAHIPQYGMTPLVEELLAATSFVRVKLAAQVLLAENLDKLVCCLPMHRAIRLLKTLTSLLTPLPQPSRDQVTEAFWRGAAKVAAAIAKQQAPFKESELVSAVQSCLTTLLAALPTPVPLLPGHILQLAAAVSAAGKLQSKQAVHPHAAYAVPAPFLHPYRHYLRLWAIAAHVLSQMDLNWVLTVTDARETSNMQHASTRCFFRALLVLAGRYSSRELLGCQAWLMNTAAGSEGGVCIEAAMVAVALASSTSEPRSQVQNLLDTLHACKACCQPDNGATLAACMVAAFHWRAHDSAAADVCFTLFCPKAAVAAFPHMLASLVSSSSAWSAHVDAVLQALMELMRSGKCGQELTSQVRQSLVSVRQALSPAAWRKLVELLCDEAGCILV